MALSISEVSNSDCSFYVSFAILIILWSLVFLIPKGVLLIVMPAVLDLIMSSVSWVEWLIFLCMSRFFFAILSVTLSVFLEREDTESW